MQRFDLLNNMVKIFKKTGLPVFVSGKDYLGNKPDMVVVYPDKKKYYIVEGFANDDIENPHKRLKGSDIDARHLCLKLYPDPKKASVAAAIYCDLGKGVDLFRYNEIAGLQLSEMQRYAALVYPISIAKEMEKIIFSLDMQFEPLPMLNMYTLTLFSITDTKKMADYRKFMHFLVDNSSVNQ